MTGAEIASHFAAFFSGAGPTVGLVLRERAKRQTAEATALVGAIEMAKEALERAKGLEAKTDDCEKARAQCERRTLALHNELEKLRRDLEMSGSLKSDPERAVSQEVVEAWNEGFAKKHAGAEQ